MRSLPRHWLLDLGANQGPADQQAKGAIGPHAASWLGFRTSSVSFFLSVLPQCSRHGGAHSNTCETCLPMSGGRRRNGRMAARTNGCGRSLRHRPAFTEALETCRSRAALGGQERALSNCGSAGGLGAPAVSVVWCRPKFESSGGICATPADTEVKLGARTQVLTASTENRPVPDIEGEIPAPSFVFPCLPGWV